VAALKYIVIVRHAKAEKRDWHKDDIDRGLTVKGRKTAQRVAEEMSGMMRGVQLILSSDAKRALQTAKIFAQNLGYDHEIKQEAVLYSGSSAEIARFLALILEGYESVMVVGHNPMLDELATILACKELHLKKAAAVCFAGESWEDILSGKGEMVWNIRTEL
jgi:phosphohistidine phosphatase